MKGGEDGVCECGGGNIHLGACSLPSDHPQWPLEQRPRGLGSDGFLGIERLLFY
jgi:hypothetical protein